MIALLAKIFTAMPGQRLHKINIGVFRRTEKSANVTIFGVAQSSRVVEVIDQQRLKRAIACDVTQLDDGAVGGVGMVGVGQPIEEGLQAFAGMLRPDKRRAKRAITVFP